MERSLELEVKEYTAIKRTIEWENQLLKMGWIAPISLERVSMELKEAEDATTNEEEEKEIGDVLQVLIRHCARKGYDPILALTKSLNKNILRTYHCIGANNGKIPVNEDRMNTLWQQSKKEVG